MVDGAHTPDGFTEDEIAFLRHVRFGELPARVLPADRVQSVETEPRRDLPDDAPDPRYHVHG